MQIEARDGVRVVHLGDGLNQFDAVFVDALDDALATVEADADATALVTTGGGKHYSNGYDLAFLGSLTPAELGAFIDSSSRTLGRLLSYPLPTVAAMNGHAFGIGALLALAHDQRVQNAERGWFCLPEVDLGMRFNRFQLAVVLGKLTTATANEAVLSGRRYDGASARSAGIVDGTSAPDALVDTAVEVVAHRTGKERSIAQTLKRDLHAAILEQLPPG
jgi:enoyl-CoA hydratase/carnithine racemase